MREAKAVSGLPVPEARVVDDTVRVQFLGTGGPLASGGRLQTCILIESGEGRYLVDCGMTALVSMARFEIDPGAIDAVLITHLHGDHYGGLPLMILEACIHAHEGSIYPPRTRPLRVAGPSETEERVRQVLDLFGWRTQFAALKDRGLLEFISLAPRRETVVDGLTVAAFPVVHYTPEATALRMTVGGKTIAYSGDTGWTDTLLEVAADADLFICQTYTIDIPQWGLLNYRALRARRDRLTCKRLVLTHVGTQLQNRLAEVNEEVAADGLVITL
jgi:ribonuclease BN (tRNA processing enzyme)